MDQLAGNVKHGDHLCVICEDPRERIEVAAQYVADGLGEGEFVTYAADAASTEALRSLLANRGVDVDAALGRGALSLPTAEEAYLRGGAFDPDRMYDVFDRAIDAAVSAGFSGCRFAGEPLWAIERESLRPGLVEFETRLNGLFRGRKAVGLCVYDKRAWPASVVRDVLRTHPIAVVGDLVCKRNLYYERPDLLAEGSSADAQVTWMLSQLRELRTQEARLELALEAGRLGSWELDLRTDTSVRSLRHDRIFGHERLVPDWGYEVFMRHVLPEDRDRVDAAFRQALERGTTWNFECRIRRAGDGAVRWIEAHGRPDPEGSRGERVERLLGIVADVTERKEMEQALREADRRKDEFIATLAHELRNPLAPILSALELMRARGTETEDPQRERARAVAERQTRHLVRLVDDLLDVSRITTGRIDLRRERVELQAVLASAVEASQPLVEAGRHAFSLRVPKEPLYLEGDATRLAQVFLNLLNNAAKYTPEGGHIELEAARVGGDVVVRVRDDGAGMPPDLLSEVFEMFVQGHRTGERAHGGLGLGLALAKRLLELHGGAIEARSAGPGRGSEFVVRLPTAPEPSGEARGAREGDRDDRNGRQAPSPPWKRILVVDDNTDAADCLAENLELMGYRVTTSYDGRSALEAASSLEPDLVILDIGLPDMDGYEVARRMRARAPGVKLVALTGWGQEKDRERARAAGFDAHRTKPVDPSDLLAAISFSPLRPL